MRSEQEIRKRLAEVNGDERMSYKSANIQINAPLALIQLEGESVRAALEWVLGDRKNCAGSFPTKEPR